MLLKSWPALGSAQRLLSLCDWTWELLNILISHSNTAACFCAPADHGELERRQTGLRTKRRERRTRLDPLAGGGQAAFGENVWMAWKEVRGEREGEGGWHRTRKIKTLKEKDGKKWYAWWGGNMQIRWTLGVTHDCVQWNDSVFVCKKGFEITALQNSGHAWVWQNRRKGDTKQAEASWIHILMGC